MVIDDNFFKIIRTTKMVETIILVRDRKVRPISGGQILSTSEEGVTIKVTDGDVFRIGEREKIYIWNGKEQHFEVQ